MKKSISVVILVAITISTISTTYAAVTKNTKTNNSTVAVELCKKYDSLRPVIDPITKEKVPRALSLCAYDFNNFRTKLGNPKLTDAKVVEMYGNVILPMFKSLDSTKTLQAKKKIVNTAASKLKKSYGATNKAVLAFTQEGYNYISGKTKVK